MIALLSAASMAMTINVPMPKFAPENERSINPRNLHLTVGFENRRESDGMRDMVSLLFENRLKGAGQLLYFNDSVHRNLEDSNSPVRITNLVRLVAIFRVGVVLLVVLTPNNGHMLNLAASFLRMVNIDELVIAINASRIAGELTALKATATAGMDTIGGHEVVDGVLGLDFLIKDDLGGHFIVGHEGNHASHLGFLLNRDGKTVGQEGEASAALNVAQNLVLDVEVKSFQGRSNARLLADNLALVHHIKRELHHLLLVKS